MFDLGTLGGPDVAFVRDVLVFLSLLYRNANL